MLDTNGDPLQEIEGRNLRALRYYDGPISGIVTLEHGGIGYFYPALSNGELDQWPVQCVMVVELPEEDAEKILEYFKIASDAEKTLDEINADLRKAGLPVDRDAFETEFEAKFESYPPVGYMLL